MPNMVHFTEFLKNAKIEKFKYDILSDVNQAVEKSHFYNNAPPS